MSATPEAKVKKAVQTKLKENNAYYCTPVTGGFGRSGVPDILACYRGFFVGIECKAGKGKVTALQQKNLDDIVKAGGGVERAGRALAAGGAHRGVGGGACKNGQWGGV